MSATPPNFSSITKNEKNKTIVEIDNKLTNDFKTKIKKKNNENNLRPNFGEQNQSQLPSDYNYSEVYLGNGRYVDLNENEIGYVPKNTSSIQKSLKQNSNTSFSINDDSNAHCSSTQRITSDVSSIYDNCVGPFSSFSHTENAPFQSKNTQRATNTTNRRLPNQCDIAPSFTAPDLKFLNFKHIVSFVFYS